MHKQIDYPGLALDVKTELDGGHTHPKRTICGGEEDSEGVSLPWHWGISASLGAMRGGRVVPHWLKCSSERVCPTPELQRAETLTRTHARTHTHARRVCESEDARYVLVQIEIPPQGGLRDASLLISHIIERGTCVRALHTHTHTQEHRQLARPRTQTMFLVRCCRLRVLIRKERER